MHLPPAHDRPARRRDPLLVPTALAVLACLVPAVARAQTTPNEGAPDLLTFAAGVLPLRVEGSAAEVGTDFSHAVYVIDGDATNRTMNLRLADAQSAFVFVFALPARTTFSALSVPEVHETPSANQTFVGQIEVTGSDVGPDGPFVPLASGSLATHDRRGQTITLTLVDAPPPVRWLRVRLFGSNQEGARFLEFSELVGHGTQESVPLQTGFDGQWAPRGGGLALRQDGAVVTGCADNGRYEVHGTVTGSLLYATHQDPRSGTRGAMILAKLPSGEIWGLRSDNGGPFRLYHGEPADAATPSACGGETTATLGCGDTVYGIHFGFDDATILPSSAPVMTALVAGLQASAASTVQIVGHTSSEGGQAHNQRLSEARAAAVVEALVASGLPRERLQSAGHGPDAPVAPNTTETGRALNRRVEVVCVVPA